ncbi:MAG TPA: CvpA family protein [Burkholderiales bacterium]|jgi:membrane protein required for colicin V production|nr:CvpA family protein [Burkholderiales bacterium]
MTWLDYAVLGVVGLSILWGVWRGLVRELISLAGWVIAFLAANLFAGPLAERLPQGAGTAELRLLGAFIGIFIASLVVSTLLALLLSKLAKAAGLGGLDRALGGFFGLARGVLVVIAFALVAGLTSLPQKAAWRQSASGTILARSAAGLKQALPPAFAERLRYD